MATRKNLGHPPEVRQKIKAGVLADRLEKHALGEIDMTPTQVRAAEILLKKAVPDLSAITLQGAKDGDPIRHLVETVIVDPAQG